MFTAAPAVAVGGTVATVERSAEARTTSVAFTPLVSILPARALMLPASVSGYEPGVFVVTLMLTVQLAGPTGSEPLARLRTLPTRLTLPPHCEGLTDPDTARPTGNVSLKPRHDCAEFPPALFNVNVRVETPPWKMGFATNNAEAVTGVFAAALPDNSTRRPVGPPELLMIKSSTFVHAVKLLPTGALKVKVPIGWVNPVARVGEIDTPLSRISIPLLSVSHDPVNCAVARSKRDKSKVYR